MTDLLAALEPIRTRSSIFEKTDHEFRSRLDQALIDHDPPTYKAAFSKFDLGAKGISYMAFYRYARRVRATAAMIELTQRALPDECDPVAALPQVLAHRVLDAAVDESTSPQDLQSLTDAWRFAARTQLVLERHQTEIEKLKKQTNSAETDKLVKTVKQFAIQMLSERVAQQEAADTAPAPDHDEESPTPPDSVVETPSAPGSAGG